MKWNRLSARLLESRMTLKYNIMFSWFSTVNKRVGETFILFLINWKSNELFISFYFLLCDCDLRVYYYVIVNSITTPHQLQYRLSIRPPSVRLTACIVALKTVRICLHISICFFLLNYFPSCYKPIHHVNWISLWTL